MSTDARVERRTDTHLAALLVHLVDRLDRVQVVDAGVKADLVHDDDPRLLDLVLELADPGADVARRDDVRLALDRGLDDVDVVDVRDKRDDEVVFGDGLLESNLLRGVLGACVKGDRSGVAEIACEGLCTLERTTS